MSPSWIYICLMPRKNRDKKGIHEQSRTHAEEDDKGQKPPRTKDAMSPTGCLHVFCQGKTMRHGYVRLTTKRTIAKDRDQPGHKGPPRTKVGRVQCHQQALAPSCAKETAENRASSPRSNRRVCAFQKLAVDIYFSMSTLYNTT